MAAALGLALLAAAPARARDARHPYTTAHVLRYATGEDIVGLNPHLNAQGTLSYMSSLTMAWLLKYDAHNDPMPELATAVPSKANGGISPDGRRITYRLRRGAKWSDGVPFTSADVAFSVDVVRDRDNNEVTHNGFDRIVRMVTPDPYTVTFVLAQPYAGFSLNFFSSAGANPCILPKHAFTSTKINTAAYNDLPIGIGPFRYVSWKRGDSVELAANPDYFRGRPKLDRVIFKIVPDRNTMLTELTTHELDLWLPIAPAFSDRVKNLPGIAVIEQPSYLYDHIDLNMTHPPLDELPVREALRLAIDRAQILEKIRHGNGFLQESVVAPSHPDFAAGIANVPFDLPRANALLDRAGWVRGVDGIRARGGKRLAFDYATSTGTPDGDQQLELIRLTWRAIGVAFDVRHYPSPLMFAPEQTGGILYGGKFDLANFAWYDPPNGDFSDIYGCHEFPPVGKNIGRYCDPAVDRAFAAFDASYDPTVRKRLSRTIQEQMVHDVATIVLDIRKDTFAFNSDLKGFHPNQVTPFDDFLRVDI